jgi:hypothetical protein
LTEYRNQRRSINNIRKSIKGLLNIVNIVTARARIRVSVSVSVRVKAHVRARLRVTDSAGAEVN